MSRNEHSSDRPLRIAMIGQQGIPARHGGIERVCEELGARLVEAGHEVTVFNSRRGATNKFPSYRGIRLRWVVSTAGKRTGNLTLSFRSTLHVLRHRYDVVHYHAMGPCIFSPLVRLRPRTAIVATIHGRDDLRAKWGRAAQLLLNLSARVSARVPDRVIVVSRELQIDYLEVFCRDTEYIPNGVTPRPVTPVEDRTPPPGVTVPYVLTVGRLVPEKAFEDLIEAFRRTPGPYELLIIGGSSHTDDYVKQLVDAASDDERIRFLGPVYGDAVDEFYRGAALFVIPSRLEGMPLTLLEAASHGLPVIVSDLPVNVEILGDGAGTPGRRTYAVGDVAALTDQLAEAFADLDKETECAQVWREQVLARYSWNDVTAATTRIYRDALRRDRVISPARTAPSGSPSDR